MPRGVLLVEDDDELRTLIAEALTAHGYQVTAVSTAAAALAEVEAPDSTQRKVPSLVITDWLLPDASGSDLMTRLALRRPELRFLVCTGYSRPALPDRPQANFLAKPFSITELLKAIAAMAPVPSPSAR